VEISYIYFATSHSLNNFAFHSHGNSLQLFRHLTLTKSAHSSVATKLGCDGSTVSSPIHSRGGEKVKTHAHVFFDSFFVVHFFGQTIHSTAKVSEGANRNMPATNLLVQLLALCTNPESILHSVTDRQTDDRITPLADHTVYTTVG